MARASALAERINDLSLPYDGDIQARLHSINGIDPGEALLFASAQNFDDFIVQTGDKRCLMALAKAPSLPDEFHRSFAGKIECFEQLLLSILRRFGFEKVKSHLSHNGECDRVIDTLFASGSGTQEETVSTGLESYIRHLRGQTADLLYPDEQ